MKLNGLKGGVCSAVFGLGVALAGAAALAQGTDGEVALRAEQAALFQDMLASPDDIDLMYRYALTSGRYRRATIST